MIYCKSIRDLTLDLGKVAAVGVWGILSHRLAAYPILLMIYLEEKAEEDA